MGRLHPAVFMDRDGVVSEEAGYVTSPEQLKIYPFSAQAVQRLKDNGWKCIIISNQSAVARGMISEEELAPIHRKLMKELPIDDIYYCPHYPPENEEVYPYNIYCTCRKPGIGLILKAVKEHGIDLKKSYMIGDRASDIMAGRNAGLKTVLVCTGYGPQRLEQEVKPDLVYPNLEQFVNHLLTKEE